MKKKVRIRAEAYQIVVEKFMLAVWSIILC
jgi:hypothetical protein